MSSGIAHSVIGCIIIAVVLMVQGCGGSEATSSFDPEASVHPPDWLPENHMLQASENIDSCKQCHGEDLVSGGISGIGCDTCHLGGPLSVHPLEWGESAEEEHGAYVVQNGTNSCRNAWCHGAQLQGVSQSGQSCNTCHPYAD